MSDQSHRPTGGKVLATVARNLLITITERDKQIAERDETIRQLRDHIAALEAEKAERERQAPVAWAWNDALGCMHAHCGQMRPEWVDRECSDATRAEMSLRKLYAAPPVLSPTTTETATPPYACAR